MQNSVDYLAGKRITMNRKIFFTVIVLSVALNQYLYVDIWATGNTGAKSQIDSVTSDIQFAISDTHNVGEPVEIMIKNTGKVSYIFNPFYEACTLSYFDSSGRRFIIPPGTHCDLITEVELKPGETAFLFMWKLDECTEDNWGCLKSETLPEGTYTIKGEFKSYEPGITSVAEKTIEIVTRTGLFAPRTDYDISGGSSVFAADLDGDRDNDLAVPNYSRHSVSLLLNKGDGTFPSNMEYAVGRYPKSVFVADLDGDDDSDLAVANGGSDNVSILMNNGDGTFAPKLNYPAGYTPVSLFAADLDGDGDNDLAVANSGLMDYISVLLNLSDIPVGVPGLVGDFDGDNEVGLSDFVRFLDVFGATTTSADWDPAFDLDDDGDVGLSDFVIFLDNFGRAG